MSKLTFILTRSELTNDPFSSGLSQVQLTLISRIGPDFDWQGLNEKMLEQGVTVNAGETVVDEAVTLLKGELEEERQKHTTYVRDAEQKVAELQRSLSYLEKALAEREGELMRLRAMEQELNQLAVLIVT